MYEKSSFPLKANSTQLYQAQIQKFFKGGVGEGVRRKILKEKCLLIHVSMHVHIKTRQTCNSFSLSLLFKKIVFYILLCVLLLYLKGGGCNTRKPPSRSANVYMCFQFKTKEENSPG